MLKFAIAVLLAGGSFALTGCATSQEAQAVREAREAELKQMVDDGLCTARLRTGSRTKKVWMCSEEGGVDQDSIDIAQESVRKMQSQGSIGDNPYGSN